MNQARKKYEMSKSKKYIFAVIECKKVIKDIYEDLEEK